MFFYVSDSLISIIKPSNRTKSICRLYFFHYLCVMNKEKEIKKDIDDMSFFEHLDAMRPGLIRCVILFFIAMVVALLFKDYIMAVIMGPKSPDFPTNALMFHLAEIMDSEVLKINQSPVTLINTTMAGQFNMHLLTAFYTALVAILPYILFELWLFVRPALSQSEIRGSRLFILYVVSCMVIGLVFGYFVLCPISVNFLTGYTVSTEITNMIDVSSYISLVANMSIVCAVVFELPVAVYFLSKAGIVTAQMMKKYRRHAIVILAIGAAIITPPDIMSMVLVIIPLYLLYELSIKIAR